MEAERLVKLRHDGVRDDADPGPEALNCHEAHLLGLRLGILAKAGGGFGQQHLERVDPANARGHRHDRTTPRPSCDAVALARSLLTTTAGRRLPAFAPAAGPRSTIRISPRSIGAETVTCGHFPGGAIPGLFPLEEGILIGGTQFLSAQQPHRLLEDSRA